MCKQGQHCNLKKTSPLLPTRSEYQVRTVSFVREGDQKKKVRGGRSLSSANGSRWLVCHNKRGSKQEMCHVARGLISPHFHSVCLLKLSYS